MARAWIVVVVACATACGGQIDPDSMGLGSSKGSGEPSPPVAATTGAPPPSPPGVGASVPPGPPKPSCAKAVNLKEAFEQGLPTDWSAAPMGLQFDSTTPIAGKTSLRINLDPHSRRTFLLKEVDPGCGGTLKLALRASSQLLVPTARTSVARLGMGATGAIEVVLEDGGLSIVEELGPMNAPKRNAHPMGPVKADTRIDVTVTFNTSERQVYGSIGTGFASAKLILLESNVTALLVGLQSTNVQSGSYWLDEIELE